MVTREEAAHALVGQPFAFEVRGGLLTVHTSASVKGEQWKQRWQQCMRDVQRGDAVCAEAIQATHMFSGDAYHLLHVEYDDKAGHRVWFRSARNRERMYDFVARPRLRVPSYAAMCRRLRGHPELWAEYGEHNHEQCKRAVENLHRSAIVRRAGEAVGTRGGIVAMQANFYAIVNHIVPAGDPARTGKVSRLREISKHWDGVCGWQHWWLVD